MEKQIPSEPKLLVIKDLIAEKNAKLAAKIPKFIYRLLSKLLHINEINYYLKKFGHMGAVDFVDSITNDFKIEFKYNGLENIPKEGKYIIAANHPLGGFDGMLLTSEVTKRMGRSLFLVRDELTKLAPFKDVFVPINKFGSQRQSAGAIQKAYESNAQILIFPAGLASRRIKGKITDPEWNKHFIKKAIQFKRDVIPVHIEGRNSNFFYSLANFRKKLGLKINLEMFLLPRELFKQRGKKIVITFGKPIPWKHFDQSHSQSHWANEIKEMVYKMDKNY
jgi:putative hemolysin